MLYRTGFLLLLWTVTAAATPPWQEIQVPGTWESQGASWRQWDGYAWYRCAVNTPAAWSEQDDVCLLTEKIDDVFEVYWNGERLGGLGSWPPQFQTASESTAEIPVPRRLLRSETTNVLAIRVFDHGGAGGFKGLAPILRRGTQILSLEGKWEFLTGDPHVSDITMQSVPEVPHHFSEVTEYDEWQRKRQVAEEQRRAAELARQNARPEFRTGGLSPAESALQFRVAAGLRWEPVLTDPEIAQPLFVSFDARGRMWLVEYRQYPHPAGLKIVSRDNFWRNVYDRVPPPPPLNVGEFRGADRISIHEDTDGDGQYDRHKIFQDGLNLATSVALGRGGVWVLNPPYLLFYPDVNEDDIPDSDPIVHLRGFGLEDSHSIANNLTWGPDGWLYGAQGSTVSAQITRPGIDEQPISRTMGQLIWRYHPDTRQFEVFAEGGGNAFGVELDAQGRIYSGHNGGNTRGFHYVQGGYYQKGFTKHGSLSNPHAYGYFPAMKHPDVERFSHTFLIYDGTSLPHAFRGKLLGVEPLQSRIVMSRITPLGSTWETYDLEHPVQSDDSWFRPVHITQGPDGCVYVCDWYDGQVNHYRNHEGQCDPTNGRVYRLRSEDYTPRVPDNLNLLSSSQLVDRLDSPNKQERAAARRLLADRRDRSVAGKLHEKLRQADDQSALEAIWGLHAIGEFNVSVASIGIHHANPQVRAWSVRLATDDRLVDAALAQQFIRMAQRELHPEVRSQLASSAKRMATEWGLAIAAEMLTRDADLQDPHLPLLVWWAIEARCGREPNQVVALFADHTRWLPRMAREFILPRLAQRWSQDGRIETLQYVAQLLSYAPDAAAAGPVLAGLEQGLSQRDAVLLPAELNEQLQRWGGGSLTLRVRQGDQNALGEAFAKVEQAGTPLDDRVRWVKLIGERPREAGARRLQALLRQATEPSLQQALFGALEVYEDPAIATEVVQRWPQLEAGSQLAALNLLASRPAWARELLTAIHQGQMDPKTVPTTVVTNLRSLTDAAIVEDVNRIWADQTADLAKLEARMQEVLAIVNQGHGSPYQGKQLFKQSCGQCHRLFDQGGEVGPDLTPYRRSQLDNLTLQIVNPDAEIREGFENVLVIGTDGRTANGFVQDSGEQAIVLRRPDGTSLTLPRSEIEVMRPAGHSVMPRGLLDPLTPQQLRDLFSYLRSAQPLSD